MAERQRTPGWDVFRTEVSTTPLREMGLVEFDGGELFSSTKRENSMLRPQERMGEQVTRSDIASDLQGGK